jgi:ribulose-5-phosphate 4-epimerase/fuculose-1-phosphate aldolase
MKERIPAGAAARFVAAAREVAAQGLIACNSGNLSWRVAADRFLVTATRSWLGELTPAQVALCRLSDGTVLNGVKPSVEAGFHAGVLRARPDISAVLHTQSPCATACACRRDAARLDFNVVTEVPYYIGPVAVVPPLMPGSAPLARAVVAAMRGHDVALLRNHGQVTVGRDPRDAMQRARFFELACFILVANGARCSRLPPALVRGLRAAARGQGAA